MEIWDEIAADAQTGANRLVAEYGDRLFTAAFRIVQDDMAAEDLVFRTFEQMIRHIDQYDGRSQFFSWMYSIMLNFRRMDLRKRGANALVFGEELPETEDPAHDPAEAISIKSDAAAVRDAVGRLAEPLRAVVTLHYFEDFGLKDIADLLKVPLGTVKYRLHEARKELMKILSPTFSEHGASYQVKVSRT